MKSKVFIDTNILIYSIDKFDKIKLKKARKFLKETSSENTVVISTQVIQEFYVAATKKLNANPHIIKEIVKNFEKFEIVQINIEMIKDAIDTSILNQISFWDALIIISAEISKCQILYTEDLNQSQLIRGVKIINPFLT